MVLNGQEEVGERDCRTGSSETVGTDDVHINLSVTAGQAAQKVTATSTVDGTNVTAGQAAQKSNTVGPVVGNTVTAGQAAQKINAQDTASINTVTAGQAAQKTLYSPS